MRELVDDVWNASQQQALLRAVMIGSLVAFAVAALVSGSTSLWAVVVMGLLGVISAVNPHSGIPATVMVYAVAVWAFGVPEPWSPGSLVAALCLMAYHTACALAAALPARAPIPDGVWRLYGARLAVVAAATTVVWGLAAAVQVLRPPGGVVAAIAGLVVLAIALGVHYVQVNQAQPREPMTRKRAG